MADIGPRENAVRTIRFDKPQYVMSGLPVFWIWYQGCMHTGYDGGGHNCPVGTKWEDIWRTVWQKEHEGVMGFPRGYPLDEPSKLQDYQWPNPDDERICSLIYRMRDNCTEQERKNKFLLGFNRDTLWEKSYMLVGMENMMMYFYTEPNFAREILHRIMDFQIGIAKHYLKAGVEFALWTDDLGTQNGPLLGPDIVREFLMPEYRRLMELYKNHGVMVDFHSCGNVRSIVEPLMDLGVNVLNPVQATANDLDELRAVTAGRLTLRGGVSTATLMDGPPQKIEAEVRRRLWQLGREGGYFCDSDQQMPFPPAHLEAMRQAVAKYGAYPLSRP